MLLDLVGLDNQSSLARPCLMVLSNLTAKFALIVKVVRKNANILLLLCQSVLLVLFVATLLLVQQVLLPGLKCQIVTTVQRPITTTQAAPDLLITGRLIHHVQQMIILLVLLFPTVVNGRRDFVTYDEYELIGNNCYNATRSVLNNLNELKSHIVN